MDSLIIGEAIECIGSVVSTNPLCAGAVFLLQPGYDLGSPQPVTSVIGSLLLDGSRPFGYAAGNRTITLPIEISVPGDPGTPAGFQTLTAAREVLLREINQQTWTLRWTRDPGTGTAYPLLFDCFRAHATVVAWGNVDQLNRFPIGLLTLTFEALPYGRSDLPVVVDFPLALAGRNAPPPPVNVDTFASVSGTQWAANLQSPVAGGQSAFWDPSASPANNPDGHGLGAVYTKTGLAVNMSQGWAVVSQNTGTTAQVTVTTADAARMSVNDQFQLAGNALCPQTAGFEGSATQAGVTNPAAFQTLVSVPVGAGLLTANWLVTLAGTLGAADANNFQIALTGAGLPFGGFLAQSVNAGAAGSYSQAAVSVVVPAGGATLVLQVKGNTPTTGAVYGGTVSPGFVPWVNCTTPNTAVQAHSGGSSLAMTSAAAGTMSAGPGGSFGQGMPCLPGDLVFVSGWFRAAVTARSCQIGVFFYDVSGNQLSSSFGGASFGAASITDSTSAWTQATWQVTAPAGAAWCFPNSQVLSTGGASEVHYVDDVVLAGRGSALLQTQVFTVQSMSQPVSGFVNVTFTPAAAAAPVTGNVAIQTAPSAVSSLVFWAGFGSTNFYKQWAVRGGRVSFAVTLTDTYNTSISFGKAFKCTGSYLSGSPRWHKIRIPVPYNPLFDYANVAGYSITTTNRGTNDLRYTQLYLSALQATPPPVTSPTVPVQRGAVLDLSGLQGSARAPFSIQCQVTGTTSAAKWFTLPGTYYWLCPPGVTTVSVVSVGAGGCGGPGTGNGGGGGGGGGSGANNAVAVTAGTLYKVIVGKGGFFIPGGLGANVAPGLSSFTGDSVTVTGPAGNNCLTGTGAAGGAAGTGGFAGGAGGNGVAGASGGGGGGGGSGGSAATGNAGAAASGSNGGAGGAAVTFGGSGGRGGTLNKGNGVQGTGAGGGSGGSPGNATGYLYPGSNGMVSLNYTVPKTFQTLVVHRPPHDAPESLSPLLPVSIGDPSDGSVAYTLQALHAPGLNAQPGGTYTIAVVANSWASPASARTITVTITQAEQVGGASYTATVSASVTPNSLPTLSDTAAGQGPIVVLGELTLPVQDLPQDNTQCYFTASITSGQITDTFSDILFLHTAGSTVIIQSPTGYSNYLIDEPAADRDLGLVMGSLFDRQDAVSVLDRALVAGGPLSLNPDGNPWMLVYAAEGAPQTQIHYWPRWHLDRYQ